MNIQLFYHSLSQEERTALRGLTRTDHSLPQTSFYKWVRDQKKISKRLTTLLLDEWVINYFTFIENIDANELYKFRGFGKKSVDEFIELRGY